LRRRWALIFRIDVMGVLYGVVFRESCWDSALEGRGIAMVTMEAWVEWYGVMEHKSMKRV